MNSLRNSLPMRKTQDQRTTELTEKSASQCGFSTEFITLSKVGVTCINLRYIAAGLGQPVSFREKVTEAQGDARSRCTITVPPEGLVKPTPRRKAGEEWTLTYRPDSRTDGPVLEFVNH